MGASVWIHGSASSKAFWRQLIRRTDGGHAVELPGSLGRKPLADLDGWQVEHDLDVVVAAIDAADQPVSLVAHSYGGLLALRAARARPDRVRQVIAHEPVIWPVLFHGVGVDRGWELLGGEVAMARFLDQEDGGSEAWLDHFFGFWVEPGAWGRLPAPLRRAVVKRGRKTYLEVMAAMGDPTPMATWRALPVPVRITMGTDSPEAARTLAATLVELVPDGELAEVAGDHGAPMAAPDAVWDVWKGWLRR